MNNKYKVGDSLDADTDGIFIVVAVYIRESSSKLEIQLSDYAYALKAKDGSIFIEQENTIFSNEKN